MPPSWLSRATSFTPAPPKTSPSSSRRPSPRNPGCATPSWHSRRHRITSLSRYPVATTPICAITIAPSLFSANWESRVASDLVLQVATAEGVRDLAVAAGSYSLDVTPVSETRSRRCAESRGSTRSSALRCLAHPLPSSRGVGVASRLGLPRARRLGDLCECRRSRCASPLPRSRLALPQLLGERLRGARDRRHR